jgi:hypothetical protein
VRSLLLFLLCLRWELLSLVGSGGFGDHRASLDGPVVVTRWWDGGSEGVRTESDDDGGDGLHAR